MQIYAGMEVDDNVLVWTRDGGEYMGKVLAIDLQAGALVLDINNEPEALDAEEVTGVQFLDMPRAFYLINSQSSVGSRDVHAAIQALGTRGQTVRASIGSGMFWQSILDGFNPPKPSPCQQPVSGGGGVYHTTGCCCGCGGIGMQYN